MRSGEQSLARRESSAREDMMNGRSSSDVLVRAANRIGALAIAVALCAPIILWAPTSALARGVAKYPSFGGKWKRPPSIGNQFDQTKPARAAQQVEFTPEYQKIFEENLKDQALGGQGTDPTYQCLPDGMPRAMNVIFPMEIII